MRKTIATIVATTVIAAASLIGSPAQAATAPNQTPDSSGTVYGQVGGGLVADVLTDAEKAAGVTVCRVIYDRQNAPYRADGGDNVLFIGSQPGTYDLSFRPCDDDTYYDARSLRVVVSTVTPVKRTKVRGKRAFVLSNTVKPIVNSDSNVVISGDVACQLNDGTYVFLKSGGKKTVSLAKGKTFGCNTLEQYAPAGGNIYGG